LVGIALSIRGLTTQKVKKLYFFVSVLYTIIKKQQGRGGERQMSNVTYEIDKLFTSKRAKQFVEGLTEIVENHNAGLITDHHMINSVVHTSLQMLVSANVVYMKKGEL